MPQSPTISYPDLPVSRRRDEIMEAMQNHRVLVVVGETGSGKTTQLPKMAMELSWESKGRVGCTQPRRIAAASVSRRVAEELKCELGSLVGYQVRFDDKIGDETRLKFMTDGILLAEIQTDPELRQYHTIILDEAHERSLNIDFLLGYLKILLQRRKDLRVVISSATLDAGGFARFFDDAPVINVEGRTFPVDVWYSPPAYEDEELPEQVCRAVEQLTSYDDHGDVLVFLPGEREIRDVTEKLEGRAWSHTLILPLFARLGLSEQQRIFHPSGGSRRIILATNVAETSLTIPGIVYVIDSGVARMSRYSAARQIQRLQIEPISQASARQRAGRCGRVCEGVCIRLYDEEDWKERPAFTDPEIRRSALAGVLLRMKSLGLPEMGDFDLPDPPALKMVTEGYRTLKEIGALDKRKELTSIGRQLARLPIDPRLGRMILEAKHEQALPEILVIVAGLSVMDPRERPSDVAGKADAAHAQWKNEESDFMSMLAMWREVQVFRDGKKWRRNQLRKWCVPRFLNMMRLIEWSNLHEDLCRFVRETLRCKVSALAGEVKDMAQFAMIHRSILAGVPKQFGFWNPEQREYRAAGGRGFGVFPGSGLFKRKKRLEWVMGVELVETTRLWMRRGAMLDPVWVEQVAPHLCEVHHSNAHWDKAQGAVYATERVVCGGLRIVDGRRVHYGRIDPVKAREIMIRDGLLADGFKEKPEFLKHLESLKEEVQLMEVKLRKPGQLWCEDGAFEFCDDKIPANICTAKAFLDWYRELGDKQDSLRIRLEDVTYSGWDEERVREFPDDLSCQGVEYSVYYHYGPGDVDDGVTLGVHIDQLSDLPDWIQEWGVPGDLERRAEVLLRTLPKDLRVFLQPISQKATAFAELRKGLDPDAPLSLRLAEFVESETGRPCYPRFFEFERLPAELQTKVWICDDDGQELAMGIDIAHLRKHLKHHVSGRFEQAAQELLSHSGMTSWDCGDLPLEVDVEGRPGFPALIDEGQSVGLKVYQGIKAAQRSHRAGCVRLARLKITDQVNHLRKKFPLNLEGRLAVSVLGASPEHNLENLLCVSIEGALGVPLPRSQTDFATALTKARQNLFDVAVRVAACWELLASMDHEIRDFVEEKGRERFFNLIAEDVQRQRAWLFRSNFLWEAGWARVPDLERYARGVQERFRRINCQPMERELERVEKFNRRFLPWHTQYASHQHDEEWTDFGYLLEEYRLSLFAPQIPIRGKVSDKRLEETWQDLCEI
ncbi:MAG: ATP-dependent RNA helicase HrpA [Akkermansia sp.]